MTRAGTLALTDPLERNAVHEIRHAVAVRRWLSRRRGDAEGLPPPSLRAEELARAAREVAESVLRATSSGQVDGELESITVVYVGEGQQMGQDPEPGVRMEWRQGEGTFGLLMPIRRLVQQAGGLESAAFYLGIAIGEPHAPAPDASRVWFLDLPSGPY